MTISELAGQLSRNKTSITRLKTVLIVDDDPAMLLLTNNILKNDGYAVTFATSGADALEMLDGTLVDIAVLDIQMPHMTGLELYKRMQADERLKCIPVIFVTSENDKDMVLQAVAMGASGYVVKPYDELALLQKVHSVMDDAKIDQGKLYLAMKVLSILSILRQNKSLNARLWEQTTQHSAQEYASDEQTLKQNWMRLDTLANQIPQELFFPMFELMVKRIKLSLSTRDIDGIANVGNLILEELKRNG
ncbi:MAG: response regulator [Treponema sp.]|jgi:CheY-like chemotaxis protein|nr:response regulator [Treponema sp.]